MTRLSVVICAAIMLAVSISVAEGESKWSGKRVLIIGDSLVGDGSGLEMGIRKALEAEGAYVDTMAEVGGRASTWAKDKELLANMAGWHPHVVVVALGMNSSRTPPKTYGRHVRALMRRLRTAEECYWVGPPLLVKGTAGFLMKLPKTITENSPCKFYDTVALDSFPKGSVSGFHVRRWKGLKWASHVWGWMNQGGLDVDD